MIKFLKTYFEFETHRTTFRKEILGAFTTFSAIAYIMIINPTILSDAGMNFGAVMVCSILTTALATFLMGALAKYPFSIAPGIGVAAYFTYSIVLKNQIPWQKALFATFCSGLLLVILTAFRVRKKILSSLPKVLQQAIICGIGLFLFFVGLNQVGIIKASHGAFIAFGSLHDIRVLLAFISFAFIIFLLKKNQPYAFILTILLNWAAALILGFQEFKGIANIPPSLSPTLLQLDFKAIFDPNFFKYFFSLSLIALFDSSAGLMTLLKSGNYLDEKQQCQAYAESPFSRLYCFDCRPSYRNINNGYSYRVLIRYAVWQQNRLYLYLCFFIIFNRSFSLSFIL